jgi:hypothetical protein
VLVNGINLFWGLNWSAVARAFTERTLGAMTIRLLISLSVVWTRVLRGGPSTKFCPGWEPSIGST